MSRPRRFAFSPLALLAASALACGCGAAAATTPTPAPAAPHPQAQTTVTVEHEAPQRESPPASGPARDISFPHVARAQTASGLELDTVQWHQLPVVYLRLVIKSGGETDPADLPGLSDLVASMLKEGTRHRTSAQIAEDVEFLGADLSTSSDEENVYLLMRATSDHLDDALQIMADVTMNPSFRNDELRKLKKRELDRLTLQNDDPDFLASREFYKALYGAHPYAHIDTTKEAVNEVTRQDLMRWHRRYVVPNNAFLVVAGDVTPDQVKTAADHAFAGWRAHPVPAPTYAAAPTREHRQVIVVDRPESVQSVIYIGNLAVPRDAPDWVQLRVANQVLGGSAASRLFMDLRERRSLTYGAYSSVAAMVKVAPFRAEASVRTQVTDQAMSAFFEHLNRIVQEPPTAQEVQNAESFLTDSFPLAIDTPGKIAGLVGDLRIFGLPDDYWDTYRTKIRQVTAAQALTAAQAHIHPDKSLVVVVGRAATVVPILRQYGPVQVLDTKGKPVKEYDQTAAAAAAGGAAQPPAAASQAAPAAGNHPGVGTQPAAQGPGQQPTTAAPAGAQAAGAQPSH